MIETSKPVEGESLFPLTPAPFERYMLVDESRAYSMTFQVVLELDGKAREGEMRLAVKEALRRHPMLTAKLVRRGLWTQWVDSGTEPSVVWHEGMERTSAAALPSPTLGCGVHLEIFTSNDQTKIHFYFHHACTDGVGAVQFIGDVLAVYGQQTAIDEEKPRLLRLDRDYLKRRHVFDIRIPHPVSRYVAWKAMLTETWNTLKRWPARLRAPQVSTDALGQDDGSDPIYVLSGEALEDYTAVANESGVTLNDLLLRDLFVTMRKWNESLGAGRGNQWLRATVPTSLRSRSALRMPAANMIGYAFLTHRAAECDHAETLLATIAGEMKYITQWGLGVFFVQSMAMVDRIPWLLWFVLRLSRRFSSIVFSNVGDVIRRCRARFPVEENGRLVAGNLVLRNVYSAPPVRPGTRLAFGVTSYDRQLTFAVRYDRKHFTADTANDFLHMFHQQIARTTEQWNVATPAE